MHNSEFGYIYMMDNRTYQQRLNLYKYQSFGHPEDPILPVTVSSVLNLTLTRSAKMLYRCSEWEGNQETHFDRYD